MVTGHHPKSCVGNSGRAEMAQTSIGGRLIRGGQIGVPRTHDFAITASQAVFAAYDPAHTDV